MIKDKILGKSNLLLKIWLIILLLANLFGLIVYIFFKSYILVNMPYVPIFVFTILGIICFIDLILVIGLLFNREYAFYGLIITGVFAFIINIIYVGLSAIWNPIGLIILYVLTIINK